MAFTYYHLEDSAILKVGKALLNWGAADSFCGICLREIYGIQDRQIELELITVIDMRKKVDLIKRNVQPPRFDDVTVALATELRSVFNLWSDDRNILAHGEGSSGDVHSAKKRTIISSSTLDQHVERSLYVLQVALWLRLHVEGHDQSSREALPPRPA